MSNTQFQVGDHVLVHSRTPSTEDPAQPLEGWTGQVLKVEPGEPTKYLVRCAHEISEAPDQSETSPIQVEDRWLEQCELKRCGPELPVQDWFSTNQADTNAADSQRGSADSERDDGNALTALMTFGGVLLASLGTAFWISGRTSG